MKHAKRLNGTVSETESDHSRTTDRDSTELKAAPVVALPPPEKGILKKKHGGSMDNFRVATPQEMVPLQKRSAVTIPRMSAHYADEFKVPSHGDDKLGDETESSEDDSDDALTPPDGIEMRSDGVVSPECPVRPSWEVSRDGGAAGNRILKLKNLNELLRQIDEQFNVVLKKTEPVASHVGSDGSSEYQVIEDGLGVGFSPPQRSPLLSPTSPDPLLNPADIRNFPPTSPMSENYEKPCRFRKRKPAPTLPVPTAVSPSASSSHSGSSHGYTALQTVPPEENVWQPRVAQSVSGATTVAPSNVDKVHSGATIPRQQPLPFTAVPYRCAKTTGGTKPGVSSPGFYRQSRSVPPPPPVRGCSVPSLKQQGGTVAMDGQLQDKDETIIVREIPKPSTLRLSSRQRATQSRCLSSPDDVDV